MPDWRRQLYLTTALQATVVLVLARPARAQLAPNAAPQGGVVVGGAASIARSASATTITQSSQRAAIDWQSFNVGARQSVNFQQPDAAAVALNRVTGPNPSQIAGQINANGQVILENQDGITFLKGAQVNTAGFMATAAGISPGNFMAGHMVFDQPAHPGARIVNQGHITVTEAGIAALVAPQVANSGVITARLGHVILAGASTWTLDLYGDGLVSIDVTGAVRQTPDGPALVTNTGTILAPGGEITLSARAAAGLVQQLIAAGGTISAPSVAGHTGQVVLNGVGGSIVVAGALLAQGTATGTRGGAIEVAAQGGDVALASGARLDASGVAGGGTVAVGTDLARAAGGPGVRPAVLSRDVTVAPGASIAADATGAGDGGRVTVLAEDQTVMGGAISAQGGPRGGEGGFVEVSGQVLGFGGAVALGARHGAAGTLLLDPGTLDIVAGVSGSAGADATLGVLGSIAFGTDGITATDSVSAGAIDSVGANGNVLLQATTLVDIGAAISVTHGLTIQSGGSMQISAGITAAAIELDAGGNLTLSGVGFQPPIAATNDVVIKAGTAAAGAVMTLDGPVTSADGGVFLRTGPGGTLVINEPVNADQTLGVSGSSQVLALQADALQFGASATLGAPAGLVVGPATPGLTMVVGTGGVGSGATLLVPPLPVDTSNPPNLLLGGSADPGGATTIAAGDIIVAGPIYSGGVAGNALAFAANGTVSQAVPIQGWSVLTGFGGTVDLTNTGNRFAALGTYLADGGFALADTPSLVVGGALQAADVELTVTAAANAGQLSIGTPNGAASISIAAGGHIALIADNISISAAAGLAAPGGTIAFAPATPGTALTVTGASTTGISGLVIPVTDFAAITPGLGTLELGGAPGRATPMAGSVTFDAAVDLGTIATTLALATTGAVSQAGGAVITVPTITGQASQVSLDAANQIGTLGVFDPLTGFSLNDATALVVAGPVTAADIAIAATGTLTLAGDLVVPNSGAPVVGLVVNGDAGGVSRFAQTGVVTIGGAVANGGSVAVLLQGTIGSAGFADLQASGMGMVLGLGSASGNGLLNVNSLLVLGSGAAATLNGAVAGDTTAHAAQLARIVPAVNPAYTFNGCEIGALVCAVTPVPVTTPPQPQPQPQPAGPNLPSVLTSTFGALAPILFGPPMLPLRAFALSIFVLTPASPGALTDPDVTPPNISDRDY